MGSWGCSRSLLVAFGALKGALFVLRNPWFWHLEGFRGLGREIPAPLWGSFDTQRYNCRLFRRPEGSKSQTQISYSFSGANAPTQTLTYDP